MIFGLLLLTTFLITGVEGQFSPGFTSAAQWGGPSNFQFQNNPGQQVSNIINAQPLGLSDQQGQQLFNRIAEQVLQSMGSTAQLNSFDTPSGFDQRFGSIQPNQLLPPGAAPLGLANNNIQDVQGSGFPGNINSRTNFNNGPSFPGQSFMDRQTGAPSFGQSFNRQQTPQQSIPPFFSRERQIDGSRQLGFSDDFLRDRNRFANLERPSTRNVAITDRFPEAIPVDPSLIHNPTAGPDPVARILRRNTRLKERLQAINAPETLSPNQPVANNIEDIRRENRQLRKLLRQKNRQQSTSYKVEPSPIPPPPPPPPPPKKNNNLGSGLLLGALGALIFG